MRLQGLHHITMITADARANVEFYADVLGLRLVKKTVNFDQPDAYHLYFGDERGTPGSILTWFEFPGAAPGRPGAGMIHVIELGVASEDALAFWEQRLADRVHPSAREQHSLRFQDYDGLAFALIVGGGDPPLRAEHPEIPREHAIGGIEGARALHPASALGEEQPLLTQGLGFTYLGAGGYRLDGEQRRFAWGYDPAPAQPGLQGAGSVHHIAWACLDDDQLAWQRRMRDAGRQVTEVLDRDYFTSIYFREPRHVLFEIATLSPGFAVDEDPQHLGERLQLPKQHEHLRPRLEQLLTPVQNPRTARDAQLQA
ncbi:MAG: VOC family protein [Solirubrobacteraceae bacterium]